MKEKNTKRDYVIGLCLGALLAVVALVGLQFVPTSVRAEGSVSGSGMMAVNGNINNERQDLIYVMDPTTSKVAAYGTTQRGTLNLLDVRNFKYDLQLDFFKKQNPSVKSIKKKVR